jgi:4-hydroxybenzoate polyprenyltransferase
VNATAPHLPEATAAGAVGRGRLAEFASVIKLSHSVFAMPWALLAAVLAHATAIAPTEARPLVGLFGRLALVVACMVTARTVAMGMNRLLDAPLDALNPRTARRAIPAGRLPRSFAAVAVLASAIAFVAVTLLFGVFYNNWIPSISAVPVLIFVAAYPLLKRFTGLCHYYLGACLALAPVCAWVAVAGSVSGVPLIMAAAVLCWTAGFDIIYACQDFDSDRRTGVFSVPAALGIGPALWVARLTHVACIGALVWLGLAVPQFGWVYATACTLAAALLIAEHAIVRADDLSKVNLAFFTVNGVIALMIGGLGILDVYL